MEKTVFSVIWLSINDGVAEIANTVWKDEKGGIRKWKALVNYVKKDTPADFVVEQDDKAHSYTAYEEGEASQNSDHIYIIETALL